MIFKIGDEVWLAECGHKDKTKVCPDCCGKKFLTVILGDDSRLSIECQSCTPGGYEPPLGYIRYYNYEPEVRQVKITGVETRLEDGKEETTYYFDSCRLSDSNNISATKEGAMTRSDELKQEHDAQAEKDLLGKTKDTRTWAWNAGYHRRCAKQAKKDLEYHEAKINVAQTHAKKDIK